MSLHIYFGSRYLKVFAAVFGLIALLVALIDFVEQMRRFGRQIDLFQVVHLVLLNMPATLYSFLPLVFIISTIALYVGLIRSSELIITRSAGRSGLVTLAGPVAVTLLISLVVILFGNPIAAAASKRYEDLREYYRKGESSSIVIDDNGLWLRQGDANGQAVIHARGVADDGRTLLHVSVVLFSPQGTPIRRMEAERARLQNEAWTLASAKSWPLNTRGNPEALSHEREVASLPTTLTQDRILGRLGARNSISIRELPQLINRLESAGFSALRHRVWLHMELALPFFFLAMVLFGAAFTLRLRRGDNATLPVLAAILLGFALYYVRFFSGSLGENGQINPFFAAWAPPVAANLLATGLILGSEDG